MTEYIVLSRPDMWALCDDKPVTIYINNKPYVLCTDECFEKQRKEPQESEDNAENDTEVWNGMGGRKVIAPKGTFEKIFNGHDTESDSI